MTSASLFCILMHMYQPPQPHIPEPPTKKVQLLAGLSFGGMALLAIAVAILSFQLVTQYHRTSDQANNASQLAAALSKTKDELTLAQRQLIIQSQLPAYDSFPAQCPTATKKMACLPRLPIFPYKGTVCSWLIAGAILLPAKVCHA